MCLYPKLIKNRKYIANKKNGGNVPICVDKRVLEVPVGCGKCIECRKQEARKWQVRLLEDVREHKNGKFITLTFSTESLKKIAEKVQTIKVREKVGIKSSWIDKNGKLCHRYKYKVIKEKTELKGYMLDNAIAKYAVRKFLEGWRKKNKKSLRHWLITELGHGTTEHMHIHGMVWTDREKDEVIKAWKYGKVWAGYEGKETYVNEETVNYCIKYVHKQDSLHKEYKPVILCSAGIGSNYLKRKDSRKNKYNGKDTREYYITRTGHKMNLPVYWRNKIYSEEEREKLWLQKLDKLERWVCGEKIDISDNEDDYYRCLEHHRGRNKRLGYGNNEKNWSRIKYENQRRNLKLNQRLQSGKGLLGHEVLKMGKEKPVYVEPKTENNETVVWYERGADNRNWDYPSRVDALTRPFKE
ncbi:MAG: replication initiator protein [Wigfec virus K19_94]|nr:MAG: replication initiator protein [Wigfec virus K19_94]